MSRKRQFGLSESSPKGRNPSTVIEKPLLKTDALSNIDKVIYGAIHFSFLFYSVMWNLFKVNTKLIIAGQKSEKSIYITRSTGHLNSVVFVESVVSNWLNREFKLRGGVKKGRVRIKV